MSRPVSVFDTTGVSVASAMGGFVCLIKAAGESVFLQGEEAGIALDEFARTPRDAKAAAAMRSLALEYAGGAR